MMHSIVVSVALLLYIHSSVVTAIVEDRHRIAIGSCSNPNKGGKIWKLIQSFDPDHLIHLGDTVYADHEAIGRVNSETPTKIVKEYSLLGKDQHWINLQSSLTDWSVVYDDHDYGANNGDKTFPYKTFSIEEFRKFAQRSFQEENITSRNGVYSTKLIHTTIGMNPTIEFTYKLILLDVRTNKDPIRTVNGDFLGEEQWNWFNTELLDPIPDLILVGSPIQVLNEDLIVEETWSEFPAMRQRLLTLITVASQLTNIVLLSGDVHRAEISQATCALSVDPTALSRSNSINQYKNSDQLPGILGMLSSTTVALRELTSSGLSHTIRQITQDSASTSTPTYLQQHSEQVEKGLDVPVRSRGLILNTADLIYQAAHPWPYRADKQADVYSYIHFTLLDILPVSPLPASSGLSPGAGNRKDVVLEYSVVSHTGEIVRTMPFPLRKRPTTTIDSSVFDATKLSILREFLPALMDAGAVNLQCVPVQGVVPFWRMLVYRAVIALALLLLVVAPLVTVLWFVGASVYYVCWGAELSRRVDVEERYQQHKKQS